MFHYLTDVRNDDGLYTATGHHDHDHWITKGDGAKAYKRGMLSEDQHLNGSRASRGQPINILWQSKGFLSLGQFQLVTRDLFRAG